MSVNLGNDTKASSSPIRTPDEGKENSKYEPKQNKKIIRLLTVIAYVISVSMAAIILSLYYVFLWDPQMKYQPKGKPQLAQTGVVNAGGSKNVVESSHNSQAFLSPPMEGGLGTPQGLAAVQGGGAVVSAGVGSQSTPKALPLVKNVESGNTYAAHSPPTQALDAHDPPTAQKQDHNLPPPDQAVPQNLQKSEERKEEQIEQEQYLEDQGEEQEEELERHHYHLQEHSQEPEMSSPA